MYVPHLKKERTVPRHLPIVLFPSPALWLPLASCWDCPRRGTSSPPAAPETSGERSAEPHRMWKGNSLILTFIYR